MKKIYPILFILAALLCACEEHNPVTPGGGGGGSQETHKVSFTYDVYRKPYDVEFTNTSVNIVRYQWDFGDGVTTTAESPIHHYSALGTYTVTLYGWTEDNTKYVAKQYITLSVSKIYLAGFELLAIPYEYKYYKIKVQQDSWLGDDWTFESYYTPLLWVECIPLVNNFSTPVQIPEIDDYWVYVYWSNATNIAGTQCLKQKIQAADMMRYPYYHFLISDNGSTAINVLMKYE